MKPTEAMLEAARAWSQKKYGKPIGNDAAEGCWNAMQETLVVAPVDMLLFCPACGTQHIDAPETEGGAFGPGALGYRPSTVVWPNPPHRTHKCKHCEHLWRPADIHTNGVQFIKTAPTTISDPASCGTKSAPRQMQVTVVEPYELKVALKFMQKELNELTNMDRDNCLSQHGQDKARSIAILLHAAESPARQGEGAVYVMFDGPPSHESGKFVEVETADGRGVRVGEWRQHGPSLWSLGPLYTHAEAPSIPVSVVREAIGEALNGMLHGVRMQLLRVLAEKLPASDRHLLLGK